jgi:hypothetical protein
MIRRGGDRVGAARVAAPSAGGGRLRLELDEATEALALAEDGRSPPSSAGSAARLWSAAGSARGLSAGSSDDGTPGGRAARTRVSVSATDARPSAGASAAAAGVDEDDFGSDSSYTTIVAAVGSLVYIFSHSLQEPPPHEPSDIVAIEVFSTAEKAREFLRWTILERRSDVDYAALLKTTRARAARDAAVRSPLRVRSGRHIPGHAAAMRLRIEGGRMDADDTAALKALMSGELGAEANFALGSGSMWERPSCTETWDDVGQGTVVFHEGGEHGECRETYRIEVKELF